MSEREDRFLTGLRDRTIGSAKGMTLLRNQIICAMLIALTVVLDYVGSFYLTPQIKISLSFVSVALTGVLLGPVPAMLNGALSDVIGWIIKPMGAFFPGYTISGLLGGLIYGLCLYRRRGWRLGVGAWVAKLLVNVFINIALNSYWLSLFVEDGYLALLPARIAKNAALYPVESLILMFVALFFAKNRHRFIKDGQK